MNNKEKQLIERGQLLIRACKSYGVHRKGTQSNKLSEKELCIEIYKTCLLCVADMADVVIRTGEGQQVFTALESLLKSK
jgi:hypothetical protein